MLDTKNDDFQELNDENSKVETTEAKEATETTETTESTETTEETVVAEVNETVEVVSSEIKEVQTVEDVSDETEVKTESQVVDEIDDQIAIASEKNEEVVEEQAVNYDSMELDALVAELENLIQKNEVHKINNQVNSIKTVFSDKFAKLLAEKKAAFLEAGGESIDFKYSNPNKIKYNELYNDFRDKRTKHYKNLESELTGNLETRVNVIEQLKALIKDADSKTMYSEFRVLQERWKRIGPVAREKYNDTWRTYHHHVERFYDLLHLSNDYRDLDFKHNLEEKLKLVAGVEALDAEKDVNSAFKKLQDIHKMWKEDIGPVAREHRDELWNNFSAATKKIHDRRHDFFRSQKGKYEENVVKKLEVIKEINAFDTSKNTSHKDWQSSIKIIEALREKFFKIGKVPKSENDKIWAKFKEATHNFNVEKNKFYKEIKGSQQENLNEKLKLIEQAEALKESEDWNATTEVMKKIQSDWKKIGHVPRKYSDKIWNQFRNACNHYFDRFHEFKNSGSKEEQEVLAKKTALLESVKLKDVDDVTLDLETIKGLVSEWHGLGKVPQGVRHIESKFSKLIDRLYSRLSIDPKQIELIKFKNQMESLVAQNNYRKLDGEQLFLRKKIDEHVREKQQLENNISFFANAKADNPLLINVQKNIQEIESKLAGFKEKLSFLSKLEY